MPLKQEVHVLMGQCHAPFRSKYNLWLFIFWDDTGKTVKGLYYLRHCIHVEGMMTAGASYEIQRQCVITTRPRFRQWDKQW